MKMSRLVVVVVCSMTMILSSCSVLLPSDPSTWRGSVGGGEVSVEVGPVTIVFPAEVAPSGTRATVRVAPAPEPSADRVTALSDVVSMALEGGQQPQAPVTLTLPVQAPEVSAERLAQQYWMFVSATDEDGSESLTSGTFDGASRTYTVSVDHFTDFRVLGIDLGAVLAEVRTSVMQGLGLEFPAPECVGKQARVNTTKYDIVSTAATHLCVADKNGNLVVSAYPGTAMPYRISTQPRVNGTTQATEVGVGIAGIIAFARVLGFIGDHRYAAAFPGGEAHYEFEGSPSVVTIELEQYPALLLMAILAETLDTLGITSVEALDGLQCLSDLGQTNQALQERLDGESVGAFVRAFFSCAATASEMSPWGKFLLAAVGAAPAFLVTSIVGIVNEFTSASHYRVELTVRQERPAVTITLGEGGVVTLRGTRYGRGGPAEIRVLTDALGPPDLKRPLTCRAGSLSLPERRWGALAVYSLQSPFHDDGSLATWEAGGISGWRYDPSQSSKAYPTMKVVGPKGIGIGTSAAAVKAKYEADDIFSVWTEGSTIEAFAGDTVDISFELDAAGRVAAMDSGWGC